jgi:hypothetical protein
LLILCRCPTSVCPSPYFGGIFKRSTQRYFTGVQTSVCICPSRTEQTCTGLRSFFKRVRRRPRGMRIDSDSSCIRRGGISGIARLRIRAAVSYHCFDVASKLSGMNSKDGQVQTQLWILRMFATVLSHSNLDPWTVSLRNSLFVYAQLSVPVCLRLHKVCPDECPSCKSSLPETKPT